MFHSILSAVAGVVMGAVALVDGSTPANKIAYDVGDVALGWYIGTPTSCQVVASSVSDALHKAGLAHDIATGMVQCEDGVWREHQWVQRDGKTYDLQDGARKITLLVHVG